MVNSQWKGDLKDLQHYDPLNEKNQLQQDRQFKNKKSMKSKTNHQSQS